jgi:hypothetical protein
MYLFMEYFYLDANGQQQGPVNANELRKHGVTKDTLVWTPSMNAWQAAGTVPELAGLFTPAVTPPYQQPQQPYQQPQQPQQPYQQPYQKPDNLLVWSILATVLCCIPSGIVAIIQSNRVNSLWDAKDYAGAREAAKNAKTWCIVSLVLGIVVMIITMVSGFLEGFLEGFNEGYYE